MSNHLQELLEKEGRYFFHTYKRLHLDIVRGEGVYLIDREGKRYLDFFGGLAVNALGYGHPAVLAAIHAQVDRYLHLSNYYLQEPQILLAERLIRTTGYAKIFLSNSGTEAMEGAIKLARKWGKPQHKTTLLSLTNSFHGRTMGALTLTQRPKYREGYDPMLPNIGHVGFNDVAALTRSVDASTLGIVLEFIQGEGGIFPVSREFAEALQELRLKYQFLIIADEIQCGIGRTGTFFGFEHSGIHPDIVVIAKAIGGGLPLGAILGNTRVADTFGVGEHGTTFGGNPVACAAGIALMEQVVDGKLMEQAGRTGEYLLQAFRAMQEELPGVIKEVRGRGCMIGVDLSREGQPIVDELQRRGILVNCTNTTVLRMLPPYIVTREECDRVVASLRELLTGAS
jgi:acetylornithine/N-succinyldiaminopimelate aminotransferase